MAYSLKGIRPYVRGGVKIEGEANCCGLQNAIGGRVIIIKGSKME
jgi:hypothetical protein